MNEERLWLLVSLQLSGEATAEELEELNALLQAFPEKSFQVEIMRNLWKQDAAGDAEPERRQFDKHLQRLSNHLASPVLQYEGPPAEQPYEAQPEVPSRSGIYRWLAVAGTVAASLLIVWLITWRQDKPDKLVTQPLPANSVITKPGSKSQITLPDGTQVWINADSKITYDHEFAGKVREVYLTGEAYFDVARDTTRPFIIHTRSIDVKVLGTAFNIRSYPDEKTTETALIRGAVEVTLHNNPDKKIILKPKEKLIINNQSVDTADNHVSEPEDEEPMLMLGKVRFNKWDTSSSVETMWVENKLAFENERFGRMVKEMERWYNVTFTVKNEQLNNLHFYGVFENKTLAEVLEALSYSRQFHYEIRDGKVTIW